ncbi:hypothetical protein O181_100661 [Austropuccinia psidii MF-1]|uniref:Uncharacterized protein n=1 Tax=Austropuccinia psidii MF-1 TaxID=1389203 RepID=A0A9Q3PHZ6_9BASI|nr:hypothetical protein [Austropuccinia psidii MF-1]
MGLKCQKQNQPNAPQKDSPVPSFPCKKTPQQWTPGPSGTQWFEDLFCHKQAKIPLLISTFYSSELTLPPFVEPSQPNEPPIPGLSQPSEPHDDALTCEPEPEVSSHYTYLHNHHQQYARQIPPPLSPSPPSTPTPIPSPEIPITSSPQRQALLIPTMRLGRNLQTCDQPS